MVQPFVGQIEMFAFTFAPRGWMACNGQTLPIDQFPDLFTLFTFTFGGDGSATFGLPDLRGRVPLYGSRYPLGVPGGEATHTLQQLEVPSHTHTVMASTGTGTLNSPTTQTALSAAEGRETGSTKPFQLAAYYDESGTVPSPVALNSMTIGATGGGGPHENMMPYLPVNFCVNVFAAGSIIPPRP
jgi:microcystin-dependent protein